MKNRRLRLLLSTMALSVCSTGLFAQTDMTEKINNPSFENDLTGWTNSGMKTQSNTSFDKKDGSIYVETWVPEGSRVGNVSVSQTLTDLSIGTYTLTATAQNIAQNANTSKQTGAYIFADDQQVEVYTAGDYSVTFIVIENEANIGFKTVSATGNWVACDNFRLQFSGIDLDAAKEKLESRITNATPLTSQKMQGDVLQDLNTAITNARNATASETGDEIQNAAVNLAKAVKDAETSIAAYASLQTSIAEQNELYGEGTGNGAADFKSIIDAAQSNYDNATVTDEEIAQIIINLENAALTFRIANATGEVPTVVTDTRYARGATMIFGRSTVTAPSGGTIKERGLCWSTSPEPTIFDNRTTDYFSNNGQIYKIKGLEPSTIYYVRAYAISDGDMVGYGDPIKVITIPMGKINYTYNNGGPADANARINAALVSAVDYWNNLTSINGLNITCNYGAGTPTADCSYGGWMRVGPNSDYQRTGTILHEMGHAVGVGTHPYWSGPSVLRANSNSGIWLGDRVTEVMRFWENDNTSTLTGDGTHMWPYGINGAHEDTGEESLYTINGLITQALGEDGLPLTGYNDGFTLPAYVFEQEDNVKYYIRNESEKYGRYTSYLTVTSSGTLKWEDYTAEEALAQDSTAWYITFNPKTCYYNFRNAATGNYITYATSSFRTASKETPGTNENIQLMRSRVDAIGSNFPADIPQRGYWMIHPGSNGLHPDCLAGSPRNRTTVAEFNIDNSSDIQRWIILTADEATAFEQATVDVFKEVTNKEIERAETFIAVPHIENVADADKTLTSKIQETKEKIADSNATATEINTAAEELKEAIILFLSQVSPTDINQPFDMTYLMSDPSLTDGSGWSTTPAISYSCGEFFQKTFDFNQTVSGLPKGVYSFTCQGFQRPGAATTVYNNYTAGRNNVTTYVYAGNNEKAIMNIAAEAQTSKTGGSESTVGGNKYVPNNMQAASLYFAKGLYNNDVCGRVGTNGGSLKVGIKCTSSSDSYWSIFDNFNLYYYGDLTIQLDETTVNTPIVEETVVGTADVGRTFGTNSQWNTLCLPFSLTEGQAAEYFTDIRKLTGISTGGEDNALVLDFSDKQTTIEASVPYIVKTKEAYENLTFDIVSIEPDMTETKTIKIESGSNSAEMRGNYDHMSLPGSAYYIKNHYFYPADENGNTSLDGFRAYITFNGGTNAGETVYIKIDGQLTAIGEILKDDDGPTRAYNVSGQVVNLSSDEPSALEKLPKGVYIINGKRIAK